MKRILSLMLILAALLFWSNQAVAATTYSCAGMIDTYLDEGNPDVSSGDAAELIVSGGAEVCRGIIRFNIPSFASAAQIVSAVLHLFGKETETVDVDIYTLTTNWYEKHHSDAKGKDIEAASWNVRGCAGPTCYDWTSPGAEGDYDTGVSSSGSVGSGWNSIDIKNLLTGNMDQASWFGVLIKLEDEAVDLFQSVASREDTANAPYLELEVDLGLAETEFL